MMGLNPTGLFHQTTSKTDTSAHSKYLLSGRRECLNLILDKLSSSKGTREASGFFNTSIRRNRCRNVINILDKKERHVKCRILTVLVCLYCRFSTSMDFNISHITSWCLEKKSQHALSKFEFAKHHHGMFRKYHDDRW